MKNLPPVLDVCCGTRMFWFDKKDGRTLYLDKRVAERHVDVGTPATIGRSKRFVMPDIQADFSALPFLDESFYHVVFDPPYYVRDAIGTGNFFFGYGVLSSNWKNMIRGGFSECFRVLKPFGTLIFKWGEVDIPLNEVLKLTPYEPLYGHRSGKKAQTHWVAFVKHNKALHASAPAVGNFQLFTHAQMSCQHNVSCPQGRTA